MPQWRKFWVKSTESMDINDMPDDTTRLLWVMLPLGLDSEGRGVDNPAWVKAKIMPLRMDVTLEMVETAMSWYADRGMITRYDVSGRKYFVVGSWHDYQSTSKEAPSQYPPSIDFGVSPELVQSKSRADKASPSLDASSSLSKSKSGLKNGDKVLGEVFKLYESEIGVISGKIKDEIILMYDDIPSNLRELWFDEAIGRAAGNNARTWNYCKAILKDWLEAGKMTTYRQKKDATVLEGYTSG